MSDFSEFLSFFLDEALDILASWEKACLNLEQDPSPETREELYRSAHNLKSGSGAVGLTEFHELVHCVEDVISKILNQQLPVTPEAIRIFLQTHSLLSQWVETLRTKSDHKPMAEVGAIRASVAALLEGGEARAEVSAGELDALAAVLGESVTIVEEKEKEVAPKVKEAPKESIRVAANKLDNLIQLVGELSMQQSILWHGKQTNSLDSKSCDVAIHLMQKIAKDLQNLALSLRLQPLQSLFQRLERAGRDLARGQGKKLDVELFGEYVELDKSVSERIADALTHIIRNAVDHGVETPEARLQSGKSETARVRLEATQEPNGILIKIVDDGRGLNSERILKKAIERGIVKPDAPISEADIHRLIFHAGLSTAEKITDVSGRGVGMDVVKTAVENIGGTIDLQSQPGKGTTFLISLPATLSIIDALLVNVDGSPYCIPLQDVAEIIDLRSVDVQAMPRGGRLMALRKRMIPVENLMEHLPRAGFASTLPGSLKNPLRNDGMRPALMIRGSAGLLAFEVDDLAGQQAVTVRTLPGFLSQIPGYVGSTILGDGNPAMILNLPALANHHFESLQASSPVKIEELRPEEVFADDEERYLIFELDGHSFGSPLMNIREIVDGAPCEPMVGSSPHLCGSLNVRGQMLPVYSLSKLFGLQGQNKSGCTYLVLDHVEGARAVQVDRVLSVTAAGKRHRTTGRDFRKDLPQLPGFLAFAMLADNSVPLIDFQETLKQAANL